jgi:biotin transport system substrate-specific component
MATLTDVINIDQPIKRRKTLLLDTLLVLGGSLFIALMAQFAFPVPFSPIPLTLQTLGVLLVGGILGSKKGALAVIAYLIEGGMGLPFFAGGVGGFAKLFGPSLGYQIGFIVAAFVVGFLLKKGWRRHFWLTLDAFALGTIIILSLGALYLSLFVGLENALRIGVYPFIIGDSLKVVVASMLIPSGWKLVHYFKRH